MYDAVVLTLGFEPGPLISAVASCATEGLSENSRIIVLTAGFYDERSERAWRQFQNIIGMMDITKRLQASLERYQIPLDDFTHAVRTIRNLYQEIKDLRVKISITGGMRALGLATFVAYLLTDWTHDPRLEIYLEGRGQVLEIPKLHKLMGYPLTQERLNLLRSMLPGRAYKPSDLSGFLRKDRSTIYRQLQALVEAGLVERADGGYRLTKLGTLLV